MLTIEQKVTELLQSEITGQLVADNTSISKSNYYNLKKLFKIGKLNFEKISFGTMINLADLYDHYYEQKIIEKYSMNYLKFNQNVEESLTKTFFTSSYTNRVEQMAFDKNMKQLIKAVLEDKKAEFFTSFEQKIK